MLLAILRLPDRPDAIALAAEAAGLPLTDVRQRLAGAPPRVLLAGADAARLRAAAVALQTAGFAAAVVEPSAIPRDGTRLIARRLEFAADRLVGFSSDGKAHEIPAAAIAFIQRGRRDSPALAVTTKEMKFSPVKAAITGGLLLTKTVSKTTMTAGNPEHCLLLQRGDGGPEVILHEKRLDYGFLGADKQPSTLANLERTLARLRALAPAAGFTAQAIQPGWLNGMQAAGIDPLDLAFHLLGLARRETSGKYEL